MTDIAEIAPTFGENNSTNSPVILKTGEDQITHIEEGMEGGLEPIIESSVSNITDSGSKR